MATKFDERIAQLSEEVGKGLLVGRVTCNQVYAKYQHERLDLKHPHGGRAHYLGGPLMDHAQSFMKELAKGAIVSQGSALEEAMEGNVEDLAKMAMSAAPKEFGDLAMSMHPQVVEITTENLNMWGASGGEAKFVGTKEKTLYDRPPLAHRLSDSELRQKSRWRDLLDREHPSHLANLK